MIAEVHLEAVEHAVAGAEGMHLHAALAQAIDVAGRQAMAADGVIQEEHLDPGRHALQEDLRQTLAEAVVADDEELQEDHLLRGSERVEDRREAGLAIHQQAHMVVRQGRHARQPDHGLEFLVAVGLPRGHGFLDPRPPVQFGRGAAHLLVGLAARLDIGIETPPAECQVGQQGEQRHEHQRRGPGDGALRGAYGEHGMYRSDHPEDLDDDQQRAEIVAGKHACEGIP
ncbi:hypothetical protein D3C78_1141800 [compost metagenome]